MSVEPAQHLTRRWHDQLTVYGLDEQGDMTFAARVDHAPDGAAAKLAAIALTCCHIVEVWRGDQLLLTDTRAPSPADYT